MSARIRAAERRRDADFVVTLGAEAFAEYGSTRRSMRSLLDLPGARVVIAEQREPSGFAIVVVHHGIADLRAIAVAETARGRGIGSRLLHAAESIARQRTARRMELLTGVGNLAALDLFLKNGFEIERRLPHFYRRGSDAVKMGKALRSG